MSIRPKTHLLLPLLALSMTLATTASVRAEEHHYQGSTVTNTNTNAAMTMQVTFGSNPRWSGIRGTRVQEIRGGNRPNYDMFRYGRSYYVYDNDRWYMSRRPSGQFTAIDERDVPREFSRVSRDHWHNSGWMDRNPNPDNGRHGNRRRG